MKYYVGIDLGTTNSAISTFDGENVRVCKNKKDQTEVMPSVIYIDKRGRKFFGKTAYLKIPQDEKNCAFLFKRFMGTSTKIKIGDKSFTPEECSAEILRELYKNLPEEIRKSNDVGTVITVPAAFNQMQNAATLEAAKMAGFAHVALMQEPVAAIMCVMRHKKNDSNFLIYDLGGGTLDVAIAENFSGKINLLAHGGKTMCGGRDFDKILTNKIVIPRIRDTYAIPTNWNTFEKYKRLFRIATYLTENAKIELSTEEVVKISSETNIEDENGEKIYIDVEITREKYNELIDEMVMESIETTRETIEKSGLTPHDIDRIIFVGGPTNYKPLCEKIVMEVGIPGNFDVNPMTAVSEGAAIFAESVNWDSEFHGRKSSRNQITSDEALGLSFRYESRTTKKQSRVIVVLKNKVEGYTFEINSIDTGWTSGVAQLENKSRVNLPLSKRGENKFTVIVYDDKGVEVPLKNSEIVISQTSAAVSMILANHSIGLEVKESAISSKSILIYLVRQGDPLPAKGTIQLRAGQTIRAGSPDSLNFKMWEGEVEDPVTDNRFIGYTKIFGDDFDFGVIEEGAKIICSYTVNDAGSVDCDIEVPSIAESFNSGKNFYLHKEGQVDLDNIADNLSYDGQELLDRIRKVGNIIKNPEDTEKLQFAAEIASNAIAANKFEYDREDLQHMGEDLLKAKQDLDRIRRNNLSMIHGHDLKNLLDFYDLNVKHYTTKKEDAQFHEFFVEAESLIDKDDYAFEEVLDQIRYKNYEVLSKSKDFMIADFHRLTDNPFAYRDQVAFSKLEKAGALAIGKNDFDSLKKILDALWLLRDVKDDELSANIFRA